MRRTLDDALCFQLVRNGRDVVRSLYPGRMYTVKEKRVSFLPNDPSTLESWGSYSRFEKLCWIWNETVSRLLEERVNVLHLEPDIWRALKDRRLNRRCVRLRNVLQRRPVKLKWTPQHEASFMAICGETMRTVGYE